MSKYKVHSRRNTLCNNFILPNKCKIKKLFKKKKIIDYDKIIKYNVDYILLKKNVMGTIWILSIYNKGDYKLFGPLYYETEDDKLRYRDYFSCECDYENIKKHWTSSTMIILCKIYQKSCLQKEVLEIQLL